MPYSSIARTSAIETTIQGKSTANAILNFLHKEAMGNFDKSDFKKNGWEVIDVNSTDEAVEAIKGRTFNNLMIYSHGGTVVDSDHYGIFLDSDKIGNWENRNSWVFDTDISEYQSSKQLQNAIIKNNIDNLISMGQQIESGKNYIFMVCNMANGGNSFGNFLSTEIGNTIDVFTNGDMFSTFLNDDETRVNSNKFFLTNKTVPENYKVGWRRSNSGETIKIKNIQINSTNGVKVIK